jgi:hypothetical protein
MRWNDEKIAEALENDATLHPVATAHTVAPAIPGF